jgi:hypothetical protein
MNESRKDESRENCRGSYLEVSRALQKLSCRILMSCKTKSNLVSKWAVIICKVPYKNGRGA